MKESKKNTQMHDNYERLRTVLNGTEDRPVFYFTDADRTKTHTHFFTESSRVIFFFRLKKPNRNSWKGKEVGPESPICNSFFILLKSLPCVKVLVV